MTRPIRSAKAVAAPASPPHLPASPWADWPWQPQEASSRRPADAAGAGNSGAAGFHATGTATWMDGLLAAQSAWVELAQCLPAALLVPFGWHLKAPPAIDRQASEIANNAFEALSSAFRLGDLSTPLEPWLDAWKPAHTEDVVA